MVPAMVALRLGAPRLRPVVEVICSLPLIVPPIAFVAGIGTVLKWGPEYLATTPLFQTFVALQNPDFPIVLVLAYVVMALPFVHRALDAGLRAVDVRTLVEAARSCGAGWPQALVRAVLPNLHGALLNAAFLTLALVLGSSRSPSSSASSRSPCGSTASAAPRPRCPSLCPCSACS